MANMLFCTEKGGDFLKTLKQISQSREYGIDLLRMVAAFYVIILHIFYRGGLLGATSPYSFQYFSSQALLALTFCAVNLFGLISGYVGYSDVEKDVKPTGFVLLWLEVVFYGILIAAAFFLISHSLPAGYWSKLIFPIFHNTYWYFTAYCLLFLFMPLLNCALRYSAKKNLCFLFVAILFFFTPFENYKGHFLTAEGYSFLWLMMLYLCGAMTKKLQLCQRISPMLALFGIVLSTLLTYFLRLIPAVEPFADQYTFPPYLFSAICYLILFANLRFGKITTALIRFIAPATFAVYISNVHPLVWDYVMKARFLSWASSSPTGLVTRVLLFSVFYVGIVSCIDFLRRKLFQMLHLRQALDKLFSLPSWQKIS